MPKPKKYPCGQCGGSKVKMYPGKKHPEKCSYCGGTGTVTVWE